MQKKLEFFFVKEHQAIVWFSCAFEKKKIKQPFDFQVLLRKKNSITIRFLNARPKKLQTKKNLKCFLLKKIKHPPNFEILLKRGKLGIRLILPKEKKIRKPLDFCLAQK
jgi:hypothetical protein